jgi:hypothetical protein
MAKEKKTVYKKGYKGKLKKGQFVEITEGRKKISGQHTMGGTSWYKIVEKSQNGSRVTSIQAYNYDRKNGLVD